MLECIFSTLSLSNSVDHTQIKSQDTTGTFFKLVSLSPVPLLLMSRIALVFPPFSPEAAYRGKRDSRYELARNRCVVSRGCSADYEVDMAGTGCSVVVVREGAGMSDSNVMGM